MHELPKALYTAEQIRALDAHAIEHQRIAGYELMCRAGAAVLRELRARYRGARRLRVWCGAGNNAGDGYVIARLARAAGLEVEVCAVSDPRTLRGDARLAHEAMVNAGGTAWSGSSAVADVEVDALLGTGLSRPVQGAFAEAVHAINHSGAPVVAVDIPSGVGADTGTVLGVAVEAELTVTFIGLKRGLLTGTAVDCVGELVFDALGSDPGACGLEPSAWRLDPVDLRAWLPARRRSAHKGSHGTVLAVGGGEGMPGALRLATEAALRSGAGLVQAASLPQHLSAIVAARPETICHGIGGSIADLADLFELAARADAVALGPGLGRSAWSRRVWRTVLERDGPLVLDADGLNLLAETPLRRDDWVLTPHPGEAARLLQCSVTDVQQDRFRAAEALAGRYGGCVVLKGAGTLVAREGVTPWLCDRGNPGMASAGMGDVLTGVIAGLLAQLGDVWTAARAGTLIHALAGDAAAADGQRGLLAQDLLAHIRRAANP